jgi:two-component system phosphate regulon response regulator PhoB
MARILIVEDEADLADLLVYNLQGEGHALQVAPSGANALSRARTFKPDLVLLDLMLPDISGHEVIRQLKADPAQARTAVVMVTARGEEEDRVKGLELGADDYVVKPFAVKELLLRVKAVLRRMAQDTVSSPAQLQAGGIALDASRHEVRAGGLVVLLTALEFRLLKTLLERPGRVQTREVLLSDVWGIEAEIMTRTVDTHIKRLREKLGPPGDIIETVRGVGYKLVPPPGR